MSINILVVDDEQSIANLIEVYLKNEGFTICKFYNGKDALNCIENEKIDLAILDVMLPDIDGFSICQQIREKHNFPVIMLTAKEGEIDKITGLTLGADDYITKPFRPLELIARVKAQLRRFTRYNSAESNKEEHLIAFSGLVLSMDTHECSLNEKKLTLTPTEFSILWVLCSNRGRVISSEELFREVWGDKYFTNSNNTVMVHIRHLREKMNDSVEHPKYIKTVWGLAIKLKNKSEIRRNDYSKIKRKVFFRIFFIAFTTAVAVIFLRFVIQKSFSFGDSFVSFLMNTFHLGDREALMIYHYVFLNNIELITIIVILIFLIILLKFTISWFTKYFDEVSAGMDKLAEESDDEILLSPELDFMEKKINQIKHNIEKQKKAALDAEQRKNDLVVYLAHDIKTPLTSVIGYLSLLDEAPDMPPEQKAKYVGITLEKAYRLEQLINEFFEITRFNLQTIALNKEKINLLFMLQQMADEFYPMLTPKEKQVSVNVPDGLTLWGDADKLARVFNNILKNAIAYSYDSSVINISAKQQDKNIVITFTNQGNPIPQGKIDTIFEKFYRLDSSRSTNTGGAGLGLAIAWEIVTSHDGTISVESNTDNTTFTVKLPS